MRKGVTLPSDWKEQLRNEDATRRSSAVEKQFQSLMAEAEAIPLRNRTQYTLYMEVRTTHILRGLAKMESVSIQELVRTMLEEGIARRVRKVPKKTAKKRGRTAKKRS